jgi:hypothetical protein
MSSPHASAEFFLENIQLLPILQMTEWGQYNYGQGV